MTVVPHGKNVVWGESMKIVKIASALLVAVSIISCGVKEKSGMTTASGIESGKLYKIVIVMDTVDDWSSGIRDGFKDNLLKTLTEKGASAEFTEFDTKLDPAVAQDIVQKIEQGVPDLICMINYPTVFADAMITAKLDDPKYRIVSENCIPVLSGIISNPAKSGGNVTGVGVFVQMNSPIRLAKRLKPNLKRLAFYSWDQVAVLNKWFKEEITRACSEEGIELVEFREVKHFEDTISMFQKYNSAGDTFIMGGISAYVNSNGKPLTGKEEMQWIRENARIPFVCYDETAVRDSFLAGTCVIWYDIGAQLSEKGARILDGEYPGDIAWDYPRKYNIVINQKSADRLNLKMPQELISAAYRIYTDYEGGFIGSDN